MNVQHSMFRAGKTRIAKAPKRTFGFELRAVCYVIDCSLETPAARYMK